jgi:MFS family permease
VADSRRLPSNGRTSAENVNPSRDAWLICGAAFVRAACVGAIGVVLAIDLVQRGHSLGTIGVLVGTGLAGATMMVALVGLLADRVGRRRTLVFVCMLASTGYVTLALVDRLLWLLPLAFAGMLNGMGRDRGPAGVLEQAMLPETTSAHGRTWVLAWYNLVLDVAHAVGALAGALPALLVSAYGWGPASAHRALFLTSAVALASCIVPYAILTSRVEVRGRRADETVPTTSGRGTRSTIRRLALLFGIDSIGGGFLSSALVGYWFLHRYGISEGQLAVLFFAARALNALSHVGAAWLSQRIGLLNTMVFTHLPSSLVLMAAPLASSAGLAAFFFLCREALVEMDVPTRQSYVMAVVPPDERTHASAATNLTRTAGWALGPTIAGFVMQHVLAGPLVVGGLLKIGYDLALYASFRHIKPPEEVARANA